MAESYADIQALHSTLTPFSPTLPTSLHSPLGFLLLAGAFGLTFAFTTLPKQGLPIAELVVATAASAMTGFGVVFLFHAAGVHV